MTASSNSLAASPAMPGPDDVLREAYRRSFGRFVRDFWPIVEPAEPYVHTELFDCLFKHGQRFVEAMVADLRGEEWARGYLQDLGVEVPPGSGKSLIFAVFLPAWAWGPFGSPWLRWMFSTYADKLTLRDSRRRRDLMQSAEYQRLWGSQVKFKKDTNEQGFYENERRGWCFSTSTGAQATGHRPHVFVGDDLLNAIKAHSAAEQEALTEHLRAMASRGVRQAAYRRLIIGQRLCEGDGGGWARAKGFEVLSLPTEYDPETPAKTRIFSDWRTTRGQLLNPTRIGPAEVAKAMVELGPYGYSAQHNQRVVPIDGGVLKLPWFVDRPALPRSAYSAFFNFWDTAYTQKVQNDQSGRVVIAIRADGQGIDVLHAVGHHLEMHELEKEVIEDSAEWQPIVVAIENKVSGISLIQNLRASPNFPFHIHEINIAHGFDKDARAHAATPFVARGLVGIDWSQPWTKELKKQLEVFPKGKKRDIADAFVHGVLYFQENYRFNNVQAPVVENVPVLQARSDKPAPKASFMQPSTPEPVLEEHSYEPFGSDYDAI